MEYCLNTCTDKKKIYDIDMALKKLILNHSYIIISYQIVSSLKCLLLFFYIMLNVLMEVVAHKCSMYNKLKVFSYML